MLCRKAAAEELKNLGITREEAKKKWPTPYVASVSGSCVLPGGTAEVVIGGQFAPGTKFFFENDNLEVVKESLGGGVYRATLKAAPVAGPQSASVMAINAVTAISTHKEDAISIDGIYEWNMEAANGWKIVARSAGGKPCPDASGGLQKYEVQFYRAGESTPFKKLAADLKYVMYDRAYYFRIRSGEAGPGAGAENVDALVRSMSDPKLTDAQRQQVINQLVTIQAAIDQQREERRQQFGCDSIALELPTDSGTYTGRLRCSEKVGMEIKVTGSLKLIKP